MSARLRLLSVFMPRSLMAREVDRIRERTFAVMDELLLAHGAKVPDGPLVVGWGVEERREAMARGHEMRVRALVEALGEEMAVEVARKALFRTGVELGREARDRLLMNGSEGDLVRAAKIMYDILGIQFVILDHPEGMRMEVSRCSLARHYSSITCLMLSAVDEGTVTGLDPRAEMRFRERITGGAPRCMATITFGGKG